MVGFTAAAAIIGLGSMAYGVYERQQGRERAQEGYEQQAQGERIRAEAARMAAQISKEQAGASVGFASQERNLNILAADQSVSASNATTAATRSIFGLEQGNEAQRRQAMEIDARRNQLEIIRNQQRGRALALTAATAQGASRGSGLQGGYGQISGQTGVNLLGIQQNLQVGRNIFDNNAAISAQRLGMADLENLYAIQRAANTTAKSNMMFDYAVSNAAFQTRQADVQTLASQGAGQVAMGGGRVAEGNAQIASGNSFFSAGPSIFSMGQNFSQLGEGRYNTSGSVVSLADGSNRYSA